jgi:hypothetical protein
MRPRVGPYPSAPGADRPLCYAGQSGANAFLVRDLLRHPPIPSRTEMIRGVCNGSSTEMLRLSVSRPLFPTKADAGDGRFSAGAHRRGALPIAARNAALSLVQAIGHRAARAGRRPRESLACGPYMARLAGAPNVRATLASQRLRGVSAIRKRLEFV